MRIILSLVSCMLAVAVAMPVAAQPAHRPPTSPAPSPSPAPPPAPASHPAHPPPTSPLPSPAPPPAPPPPSSDAKAQADAHRAAGDAHYEAGNLAAAMAEYEAAYKLDARGEFLFSMARIENDRGDCARSIDLYQRFLAGKPGPNSTRLATEAIAACRAKLAASGAAGVTEPGPPDDHASSDRGAADPAGTAGTRPAPEHPRPAPPPPAPHFRTETRPWYTDRLGDGLTGGGIAALLAGGAFYLLARADVSRADRGGAGGVSLAEYQSLRERADHRQLYAGLAAGAGSALVLAGVVRYATGHRTHRIEIRPAPTPTGAAVTLAVRF